MLSVAATPPYVAVIFSSIRNTPDSGVDDGYDATAQQMEKLARQQPGFLGLRSVRDPDTCFGITVSYWVDEAAAQDWKTVQEHLVAQQKGRNKWYACYQIEVAKVTRNYGFSQDL